MGLRKVGSDEASTSNRSDFPRSLVHDACTAAKALVTHAKQ
jgi:hypothetical protein